MLLLSLRLKHCVQLLASIAGMPSQTHGIKTMRVSVILSRQSVVAAEVGNAQMEGAAKVMKSWVFSTLTLAYGDIPYSEAITGSTDANWFPAYDTQEQIITGTDGLLDELAEAVQLLDNGGSIQGDILFNGDAAKWKKLATRCASVYLCISRRSKM